TARDLGLGLGQRRTDDRHHPVDHRVHLAQVEAAALAVEGVDLRRHAGDLVFGPAGPAEPAAVALLLEGVHLGSVQVFVGLLRGGGALVEGLADFAVQTVELGLDAGLSLGVDVLDVGGDLGALLLVLALGLGLLAADLLHELGTVGVHGLSALLGGVGGLALG